MIRLQQIAFSAVQTRWLVPQVVFPSLSIFVCIHRSLFVCDLSPFFKEFVKNLLVWEIWGQNSHSLHLFVAPLSRTVQFHGDTLTSTVPIQFALLGIDRKAHDNHVIVVQLSLSHFPTDLRPKQLRVKPLNVLVA